MFNCRSYYTISKSKMILRRQEGGDEVYCTYVEEADDPACETVSQFEKREKMLIFRNGFTPKFLKKFVIRDFNRPLFSTK